jgi:outer membrane protein assembly factor BamB
MPRPRRLSACLVLLALARLAPAASAPADTPDSLTFLLGTWAGEVEHEGERQPLALHVEPADSGRVRLGFSMPVIHLRRVTFGRPRPALFGDSVRLGPFRLRHDARDSTLRGVMPAGLVPVHELPFVLRRVAAFEPPPRAEPSAPVVEPVWTFAAGAALWAGPVFAGGVVYAGAEDGTLHAVDARTGAKRWSFRAGGAIRVRPTVSGGALYFQADDGFLHRLDAADGTLRWRVRIVEKPIERLPFDDPRSRFDRFGSEVAVAGGRLFVGTHDGRLLALDPRDGAKRWSFQADEAVLAAPAVAGGRVYFGSYGGFVHALDARTGRELWRRDTRGAVVSTPALHGGLLVVGTRAYDLLGLDAGTGEVRWKRYIWMSWVESSASLRDGLAYVGSSDAAAVFAVDAANGRKRWTADVYGWAWGQPAVSDTRVYAGASSQVGYLAQHVGSVVALERGSGAVAWRYPAPAPASGAYGFPGSVALGAGLVFAGGLDGRLVALRQ